MILLEKRRAEMVRVSDRTRSDSCLASPQRSEYRESNASFSCSSRNMGPAITPVSYEQCDCRPEFRVKKSNPFNSEMDHVQWISEKSRVKRLWDFRILKLKNERCKIISIVYCCWPLSNRTKLYLNKLYLNKSIMN